MDEHLFRRTFSRLEASAEAKEELLRRIEPPAACGGRRPAFRAVRLAAAVAAAMCLLTVTAFAASGSFRGAVVRLLFPRYGQSELAEISEGHRTGAFDCTDVLNTFLETFDREDLGDGVTVKMPDGFHKVVVEGSDGGLTALVETSDPELRLAVYMAQADDRETAGLWQVTGCQLVDAGTAAAMAGD